MREYSRVLLTILVATLSLWLVAGFWPLSVRSRVVLTLGILLICGAVLWCQWRRFRRCLALSGQMAEHNLPPEDFQGAVVLVCGDTASLFSADSVYRETRQGWYLRINDAEALPLQVRHLAAVRPALVSQVSVLLALMPEQHRSGDVLAQSLRGWFRGIVQCRTWLNGLPPVWSVLWVSPPGRLHDDDARWFTLTPDLPGIRVRQKGDVALPVADWLQAAVSDASRLYHALWLDSALALMECHLSRLFCTRQGEFPSLSLCVAGVCLTPVTPVADNLWQQQIAGITTLSPACAPGPEMPRLPDILLPYLPGRQGISSRMRDARLAGGVCFLFLALAMLASFINNQRLVRSVGEHLATYHRLSDTSPAAKQKAQQRLRDDSRLLDEWQLRGEPQRYGLGLYQGMRLILPVEAAINDRTPTPHRPVMKNVVQEQQPLRLDSLSLFDPGKWQLKPGATKPLVSALMGIKAKPGWLIVVAGYTDSTGDDKSNRVLSLKRAEAVRDWIQDTGDIPESCFAVQGYGAGHPVATNDTPEGRALNRRVEISLVSQAGACRVPGTFSTPSPDDGTSKTEME